MRFDNYKLYQLINTYDKYGVPKQDIEFISDIDVYINEQHMKAQGVETSYFIKVVQGVTKFNRFEVGETYKISNPFHEYELQSFINGRLTQLQLKEVIL